MVSIKISNTLLDQFDAITAKKGINRSEAIRAYMVDYIEKNSKWNLHDPPNAITPNG